MTRSRHQADETKRHLFDTGLESLAAVTRDAQAISGEVCDYARRVLVDGASVAGKLANAGSASDAVEIQAAFARRAYADLVAETTRLVELYTNLARDAYLPFEALSSKVR